MKGIRASALRPQNYSCSFIHLDNIYQFKRLRALYRTLGEPFDWDSDEWISAAARHSSPSLLNLGRRTPRWRDCEKGLREMDYPSQAESCLFILMSFYYLWGIPENMDSLLSITAGFRLDLTHPDTLVVALYQQRTSKLLFSFPWRMHNGISEHTTHTPLRQCLYTVHVQSTATLSGSQN